jgi:hypothetical protein
LGIGKNGVSYPLGRRGKGLGVFGKRSLMAGGEKRGRLNVYDIKCQAEPEKPSHPDVFSISRCLARSIPCPPHPPGGPRHFGFDLKSAACTHGPELHIHGAAHPRGWNFFLNLYTWMTGVTRFLKAVEAVI